MPTDRDQPTEREKLFRWRCPMCRGDGRVAYSFMCGSDEDSGDELGELHEVLWKECDWCNGDGWVVPVAAGSRARLVQAGFLLARGDYDLEDVKSLIREPKRPARKAVVT